MTFVKVACCASLVSEVRFSIVRAAYQATMFRALSTVYIAAAGGQCIYDFLGIQTECPPHHSSCSLVYDWLETVQAVAVPQSSEGWYRKSKLKSRE